METTDPRCQHHLTYIFWKVCGVIDECLESSCGLQSSSWEHRYLIEISVVGSHWCNGRPKHKLLCFLGLNFSSQKFIIKFLANHSVLSLSLTHTHTHTHIHTHNFEKSRLVSGVTRANPRTRSSSSLHVLLFYSSSFYTHTHTHTHTLSLSLSPFSQVCANFM